MGSSIVEANLTVTEDSGGTYKNAKVEIPGSAGASAVYITDVVTEVSVLGQGASVQGDIKYRLGLGDQTGKTSIPAISDEGIFEVLTATGFSDANSKINFCNETHKTSSFSVPKPVPRDSEGKYYVTGHIIASNQSAAKSGKSSLVCVIVGPSTTPAGGSSNYPSTAGRADGPPPGYEYDSRTGTYIRRTRRRYGLNFPG
jgi:hypothetical protein